MSELKFVWNLIFSGRHTPAIIEIIFAVVLPSMYHSNLVKHHLFSVPIDVTLAIDARMFDTVDHVQEDIRVQMTADSRGGVTP